MGKSFLWHRPIAFGDVDLAKILYYPNLFHYLHQAFEAFMGEAMGMSYQDFLTREHYGFPAVSLEAQYERPFPYGEEIYLSVSLVQLGKKSMTLQYAGSTSPDGPRHALACVKTVLVDMRTFESREIPDWIRDGLEQYRGEIAE